MRPARSARARGTHATTGWLRHRQGLPRSLLVTALLLGLPATAASAPSPTSRVRGLDGASRRLLQTGAACSPTIARMLAALEASDLIVGIETRPLETMRGQLRVVAASAGVRYVRIRLRVPDSTRELVSVLGHELRHAVEVASTAEVRDNRTLAAHYLRIGYESTRRGFYETDSALETGRAVAKEVAACRGRH